MRHARSTAQNGSAFFIILIAIAMFAMLSYALSKGGRSSASAISADQAKLAAEEILSFTDTVRKAVQTLRLRGCTESQISFEIDGSSDYDNPTAPTDSSCHVFSLAGGKASYRPMEAVWVENAANRDWWFSGQTPVEGIGTASPELSMWGKDIRPEICSAINKILLGKEPESEDVGAHTARFTGVYGVVADNMGDDADSIYIRQSTGCAERAGQPQFYAVLLAR